MNNAIKDILADISKYENNTLEDNIKNRLNDNLKVYLASIDNSYTHIINNMDKKDTMKELIK